MGEPKQSGALSPSVLQLMLLCTISIFLGLNLENSFNTHTSGSIHTDPVDIAHSYDSEIRALLE